jgi:hypothetical protein
MSRKIQNKMVHAAGYPIVLEFKGWAGR